MRYQNPWQYNADLTSFDLADDADADDSAGDSTDTEAEGGDADED